MENDSKISMVNSEYVRLADLDLELRTSHTLKVSFTAPTAASTTTQGTPTMRTASEVDYSWVHPDPDFSRASYLENRSTSAGLPPSQNQRYDRVAKKIYFLLDDQSC
jgi:hypothetical protein